MANALYDAGREGFLGGDIDWDANEIRLIFIDENDTVIDLATNAFLSDRDLLSRVAISPAFLNKTKTAGVADADDVTVMFVTGDPFESIDLYKHTGSDSTAPLIANIDTAVGLPCTPNNGHIMVVWDEGLNRIFKL